jgi:hypothetical protein
VRRVAIAAVWVASVVCAFAIGVRWRAEAPEQRPEGDRGADICAEKDARFEDLNSSCMSLAGILEGRIGDLTKERDAARAELAKVRR